MTDEQAAHLGLLPCKRKPNTWHLPRYRSPPCDCGLCYQARVNRKRPPHTRCHCRAKG